MSVRTWHCVAATLTMVACTQSYDSFDFAGGSPATGGSPPTNGASAPGGSDGTGGSGGVVDPNGGNGGVPSTGGMGTGGEGGTPPVLEVPCGSGGTCDLGAGDVCCISENGDTDGSCDGSCNPGNEASLECNEPSDCPGDDVCCLVFNGSDYDAATCKASCEGTDEVVCDPETSEPCSGSCQQVADLPAGFKTCQ